MVKLSGKSSVEQLSQHHQTFAKTQHISCWDASAVTVQATLGLENGLNGNWLLNEEKITLLMVSVKCVWWLAESNWMQRQAGKHVIFISVLFLSVHQQ